MTVPSLLLALLIALMYGALYHVLRGGGLGRLLLYLGLSILGFVAGHLLGEWRGWVFFRLGLLNLGMSSAGSVFFLLIGDWFSRVEAK